MVGAAALAACRRRGLRWSEYTGQIIPEKECHCRYRDDHYLQSNVTKLFLAPVHRAPGLDSHPQVVTNTTHVLLVRLEVRLTLLFQST